jgi:hypothetical protein
MTSHPPSVPEYVIEKKSVKIISNHGFWRRGLRPRDQKKSPRNVKRGISSKVQNPISYCP